MNKYIRISEWIKRRFEGDEKAPHSATVRTWLEEGHIKGRRLGKVWWVQWPDDGLDEPQDPEEFSAQQAAKKLKEMGM